MGAPQARLSALAAGLAARGVSVVVHSGPPHYPNGRVLAPYANRALFRERHPAGFRIVRSAVYLSANRGFAPRLANHASFAASALATAPASGPADVVLVETPPLFLAGAAIAYARLKRALLAVHVSDLWPDSAIELDALTRPRAIGGARAIEQAAYRAAATVVAPTEGICARLRGRPESAGKVVRIAPSVDLARFPATPASVPAGAPLRALYAGTLGLAQGLTTLVAADEIAGPAAVEVTIAGDGAEAPDIAGLLAQREVANVELLGTVPHNRIPGLYAACHAAVVMLRDRPVLHGALPTKMLEAMASARPVVLSAAGEAARFVERYRCGLVVPPEDPQALAKAWRTLAQMPAGELRAMGERGRAAAAEFSAERAADRWLELFERLMAERGRPAYRPSGT